MRILLAVHSCYTDRISGAMHCLRTLAQWLAGAGHAVQVLSTVRMDVEARTDPEATLAALPCPFRRLPPPEGFLRHLAGSGTDGTPCGLVEYELAGVPVQVLLSRHNQVSRPDRCEFEQFLFHVEQLLLQFRPDLLLAYGDHPAVPAAMQLAKRRGVATLYTVRSPGFETPALYRHADHVLTPSRTLSRRLETSVGVRSTAIPSPLDEAEVLAQAEGRAFVTYVNPAPHKGVQLFARLADMLGGRRPDIPILVVQSAAGAGALNSIPGIDFARYPQIVASPPLPHPKDFLALSRLVLMPSTFEETFGRVAAEAMLNGIPPLVSDRGALPETLAGAGFVLPLPGWLGPDTNRLPSEAEAQPWFDTVCRLWDDEAFYGRAAAKARRTAQARYGEKSLRRRYLAYLEDLTVARRQGARPRRTGAAPRA